MSCMASGSSDAARVTTRSPARVIPTPRISSDRSAPGRRSGEPLTESGLGLRPSPVGLTRTLSPPLRPASDVCRTETPEFVEEGARPALPQPVVTHGDSSTSSVSGVLVRCSRRQGHFPIKRGVIFDKTIGHVFCRRRSRLQIRRVRPMVSSVESGCDKSTSGAPSSVSTPTEGSVVFDGV